MKINCWIQSTSDIQPFKTRNEEIVDGAAFKNIYFSIQSTSDIRHSQTRNEEFLVVL